MLYVSATIHSLRHEMCMLPCADTPYVSACALRPTSWMLGMYSRNIVRFNKLHRRRLARSSEEHAPVTHLLSRHVLPPPKSHVRKRERPLGEAFSMVLDHGRGSSSSLINVWRLAAHSSRDHLEGWHHAGKPRFGGYVPRRG